MRWYLTGLLVPEGEAHHDGGAGDEAETPEDGKGVLYSQGEWQRRLGDEGTELAHGVTKPIDFVGLAPESSEPDKQWSIHWTSGGDPKILVRRPTQLGTNRVLGT